MKVIEGGQLNKFFLKMIGIIFLIGIVFIIGYGCYLWFTYIDKTITEKEGYGFVIGSSKREAYLHAQKNYRNVKIFIIYPMDERQYGPLKVFTFTEAEYGMLATRDTWQFYFDEGFFDTIVLTFNNDKLIKIYRHRKKFELP